ncbi:MAG: MarR family transcriptional regulator [Methanobacteriaceae archaeon]|nr:MarR family transcriptional regulator [Methanobacteriaceae archaeon]
MKDSDSIKAEFDAERLDMEKYILVVLFLVEQRWSYVIGREMAKDQITTKQWLMMIVLANAFQSPPSMQEMADAMSTTHQNVKQLASRLEARGFVKIERDSENRRILRLKVTRKCQNYWEKRSPEDMKTIKTYFEALNNEEIRSLFHIMGKLEKSSLDLYEKARKTR